MMAMIRFTFTKVADALAQVCSLLPSPLDLECTAMVEVILMLTIMMVALMAMVTVVEMS